MRKAGAHRVLDDHDVFAIGEGARICNEHKLCPSPEKYNPYPEGSELFEDFNFGWKQERDRHGKKD